RRDALARSPAAPAHGLRLHRRRCRRRTNAARKRSRPRSAHLRSAGNDERSKGQHRSRALRCTPFDAVALPQSTMFGEDLYRDPVTKAAALLRSLSQNHGFEQGNKRTAWISMRLFLAANGFEVNAGSHEVLELMTGIATHQTSIEGIVEFILDHVTAYPDEHRSDEAL
ncbi:type II toxin-antitoxin system death-on-curing family toxin, partial [bacterium]